MTPNLSGRHFALVGLTFAYLIVASVGAIVATGRGLPAEAFGLLSSENEVWIDALVGGGTALSPPVFSLALMAAVATASLRADRVGRVSTLLLSGLSALTVVGAIGEPITWRSIGPGTFDPLYLSLSVLMVAVPAALAVVAFSEFRVRRAQGARARGAMIAETGSTIR